MSASVEAYREEYRRQHIAPGYNGWLHFTLTFGTCTAAIVFCALQLQNVLWWEWLFVPLTFLFANLTEHYGHRNPMHRFTRGLGLLFERHTRQHHRFFTNERMELRDSRDHRAVLFPPVMLLFFFGAFAVPAGVLVAWLSTPNAAYLFALMSVAYFMNYEILHWAYHQPAGSWIRRVPGMETLRRLHTTHHNPELMSHYNFNITYPIADAYFGTRYRGDGSK